MTGLGARLGRRCRRQLTRIGAALGLVPPAERLDLLFGTRAIARFMGLTKSQARSLVARRAIPWFTLAGVVCARRASIRRHLRALERREARGHDLGLAP